jgi:hypothetical protein
MNYTYLRFGDRLPSVGVLQKLLCRVGTRLDLDGIFGPKTRAAVLEFQRRHRPLVQDGLVGIQTWARLTEGENLPIVDCVDVFDTFERDERLKREAMRAGKLQGLVNQSVMYRMQMAELLEFAKEIEVEDADEKPSRAAAPPLARMNKVELIAAITKKLAEDRKKTSEWADSIATEVDDIRGAGGNPLLIGGMCDGVEQAVTSIAGVAREAFLLRFHAHGNDGRFALGAGRAGEWEGNRVSKGGYFKGWLPTTLGRLRGTFGPYGSVELMSCKFMAGADGPPMLQTLADIWGVPVSAGVQTQLAGGTATFRFEGPTRTAFPNAGGLAGWCRSLPDFPKQNASFPH